MNEVAVNSVSIQHALEKRVSEFATIYISKLLKLGEQPTRKQLKEVGLDVSFCDYVTIGTFITRDMMRQMFARSGLTNPSSPFSTGKVIAVEMNNRRYVYNEKRVKWIFGRSEYAGDERAWAKLCVALGFKTQMAIKHETFAMGY